MTVHHSPRVLAISVLASLSLLLTGCFITPGKFASELVLMDEDRFTFTYEGEIFFLAMSDLAAMSAAADEFEADSCYDEETFENRECTEAEIAEQRAQWDASAEARAAENAEQAEQMRMMMGGIDPSDPEASAELVAHLLRQKGWERVEDKGDGVFDIRYSVDGTLGHDFMFPVIEGFPTTNPFVQIILRDGNVVRVNAPGFAPGNETTPMSTMMSGVGGMGGLAAMQSMSSDNADGTEGDGAPNVPVIDGTFRIVTNGRILANNTDEGPSASASGEVLEWTVSPRTTQAPTALVDLTRR